MIGKTLGHVGRIDNSDIDASRFDIRDILIMNTTPPSDKVTSLNHKRIHDMQF